MALPQTKANNKETETECYTRVDGQCTSDSLAKARHVLPLQLSHKIPKLEELGCATVASEL